MQTIDLSAKSWRRIRKEFADKLFGNDATLDFVRDDTYEELLRQAEIHPEKKHLRMFEMLVYAGNEKLTIRKELRLSERNYFSLRDEIISIAMVIAAERGTFSLCHLYMEGGRENDLFLSEGK